ncbi:sodium/calcium exchanger NCL-like [Alnus glutinosa]|uniref:sodium/calcium exchanger NCL-like n=1 Tax=Alnus glutinosa TaxID=3517 RepID=UPI002D76B53F|nr:sodium/calcium exchanger NCL-like [Alnus glutinosa]
MENKVACFFLAFFFLTLASPCRSRPIFTSDSPSDNVSDGIHSHHQPKLLYLNRLFSSDTCTETYGFLPCTTTVLGNVFLILVYSYLMFLGAKLLSDGSEILLEILGPGIIGGFFLPVLSSLPDATIILASGLSGSTETAQSQVSVGMGLLAGSTVMLLTILWGSCLIVGKCDLDENSVAVDQKDTKTFSFTGSGVSTDIWTSYAARIMIMSIIPLIIVQLPQVFQETSLSHLAVLVSLVVSICLLIAYSLYQIFQPWIQKRRLAYAKHKHVISGILRDLKMRALGRLYRDDGEPNTDVIEKLFKTIDQNSDGSLSEAELRALVIGINFEEIDADTDDAIAKLMKDFDASRDTRVDVNEFVEGISRWLKKARHSAGDGQDDQSIRFLNHFHQQTKKEADLFSDQNDEAVERIENAKWHASKAGLMLLLGTLIAAVIADPLVDVVDNFSTATSIPSFFVSFVILPFASSSEVVSTLIFARKKKSRMSSLMYSEIYGSVTMANVLSLAVFLGLVYFRDLTWDFSSEVLVVLVVCIVMGLIASFRTTFPLWISLVAYALYPLSLLLVYILNYVVGWS